MNVTFGKKLLPVVVHGPLVALVMLIDASSLEDFESDSNIGALRLRGFWLSQPLTFGGREKCGN